LGLQFKASISVIDSFKKKYAISSTKVEKYVSDKNFLNIAVLDQNFNEFRSQIIEQLKNFKHDFILNSNQTGFQYEIASK
jgi:hypothetical protein